MGLSDVAGVLSRYFVIGFFAPSFFALVSLSQALTKSFLPPVYKDASSGARVLIVGGAALLVGLVLVGLNYPILRLFEGYPLRAHWYTKPLSAPMTRWQKRRLKKAIEKTTDKHAADVARRNAKWSLDRYFAADDDQVLPTGLGNAIRAFERHSRIRWGLNGIAAWPRIEMLLKAEERQVFADAKGDLAFFINGSLLAALAGLVLIADQIVYQRLVYPETLVYVVPFVVSALLYSASVPAAIEWGDTVRACIDLHRLELYKSVGLRAPLDFTDEREKIAPALNALLLRGEPIHDQLAANPAMGTANTNAVDTMRGRIGPLSVRVDRTNHTER